MFHPLSPSNQSLLLSKFFVGLSSLENFLTSLNLRVQLLDLLGSVFDSFRSLNESDLGFGLLQLLSDLLNMFLSFNSLLMSDFFNQMASIVNFFSNVSELLGILHTMFFLQKCDSLLSEFLQLLFLVDKSNMDLMVDLFFVVLDIGFFVDDFGSELIELLLPVNHLRVALNSSDLTFEGAALLG